MKIDVKLLFRGEGLRAQLLRGGSGNVALSIASGGLSLVLAIVLARTLGPKNFGVYSYVFALVSLLAVPAQFGLPTLVVRETAKAEARHQWGVMRGLWRWAGFSAAVLAFILALSGGTLAWLFSERFNAMQLITFAWGLALVPLIALGALRGAALSGLRKVVQGQLPERIIRPFLLVLFVLGISTLTTENIQPDEAMALHALAAAIAFAIGAWLLRREQPDAITSQPTLIYESRRWFSSAIPLALIAGMSVINTQTDIVMLGIFSTAKDVGVYRVAAQGATLVALGLSAIGVATMPYFARFHAEQDMAKFQKLATIVARASLFLAALAVLVFILFGRLILHRLFGEAYIGGYAALVILSCAQLVNAGFGSLGPVLSMSGFERDTAIGIAIAAICNIILNLILIPKFDMIGAAFATGITLVIWNVVLWSIMHRRLGIDSTALGIFHR